MKADLGVHETHCCPKHGCKYGEKDCPVKNGSIAPYYGANNGCEACEWDAEACPPLFCPKCGADVEDTGRYRGGTFVCSNSECSWWIKHGDWSPEVHARLASRSLKELAELHRIAREARQVSDRLTGTPVVPDQLVDYVDELFDGLEEALKTRCDIYCEYCERLLSHG